LPTLPYPEVTRFEIVHPKPEMQLAQNDNEVVLVETDADAQYDREKRIAVRFEPDVLELAAVSPLRGGRMRWRLRAKDGATVGQRGKIIATMTKPNGTQLMDSTDFEILPPEVETTRKSRGDVPPFEIFPINPTDDQERWGHLWPQLDGEQDPHKLGAVAYKPDKQAGGIFVYYSTVFEPFAYEMERLKTRTPALVDLFRRNYEIWIAYHAILQIEDSNGPAGDGDLKEEVMDRIQDEERIRVATTQVKQAIRTAEIMHQVMKLQASSDD
jgi:hypothetical protein